MAAEGTSSFEAGERRLKDAGAAYEDLKAALDSWSGSLATYGNFMVYAVIAGNWAVHGDRSKILDNDWAKWSLIVAVCYLGLHLLAVGWMALLHRRRCHYANENSARWSLEYLDPKRGDAWPYTNLIQNLGEVIRFLHVLAPLASGLLLVVSLFRG